MRRLAETQVEMKPVLEKLATGSNASGGNDEAIRAHLRSIDNHLQRLIDETTQSRDEISDALRREIRLLARTIAATGEGS